MSLLAPCRWAFLVVGTLSFLWCGCVSAEPIRVGVSVTLTGEAATFGIDMKNAITLANDDLGGGRYQLFFDDERCSGKDAVSVAQKFISVDKVSYAIGFSCNQALIPASPLYERAGVPVISAFATSGDIESLGKLNFRLFPADHLAVKAIFPYIASHHRVVGIVTEENEYPELMRRTFERLSREKGENFVLIQESFKTNDGDLRQLLQRFKTKKVEALFLNPNAEPSFIRLVQQLKQIHYAPALYSAYWPGATVVQEALGSDLDGMVFANLPALERLLSPRGLGILERFTRRFGEPNSVPYNIAFAYESFRLLDAAIRSGQPIPEYLGGVKVTDGAIGSYSFDGNGAIQGISFEIQRFENGKVTALSGSTHVHAPQ